MSYIEIPRLHQLVWARCGVEGRWLEKAHMFLVASRRKYNTISKSLNAFVLTSKRNDFFRLNYGVNITNDDIIGDDSKAFNLFKETLLTGFSEYEIFEKSQDTVMVSGEKFDEIKKNFIRFIKENL